MLATSIVPATVRYNDSWHRPWRALGGGFIAVGDGAVFVATFEYDGSPYHLRARRPRYPPRRFTVDVPGTHVFGDPKARLAFGAGAVWFSEARCRS